MTRRRIALSLIVVALSLAGTLTAFAQEPAWNRASDIENGVRGTLIGRVTDINVPHSQLSVLADSDPSGAVITVNSDAVATDYHGFGANDDQSSLRGSNGFSQVKIGDRVRVTGVGGPAMSISAAEVRLLDHATPPPPASSAGQSGTLEGVVRQIDAALYRVTIETDRRELITIYGSATTSVTFHGDTYRIPNIGVGDRIRVEVETKDSNGIRPRSIQVLTSASVNGGPDASGRVTSLIGSVSAIDSKSETFKLSRAGGDLIKIDARFSTDSRGRTYRLVDLHTGDLVEVSGQYLSNDSFRADTIRPAVIGATPGDYPMMGQSRTGDNMPRPSATTSTHIEDMQSVSTIVIYGTVTDPLQSNNVLKVKDSSNNKIVSIDVVDDFPVRLKAGGFATADQLKKGDSVVIQAYHCGGHDFAQTMRTR